MGILLVKTFKLQQFDNKLSADKGYDHPLKALIITDIYPNAKYYKRIHIAYSLSCIYASCPNGLLMLFKF